MESQERAYVLAVSGKEYVGLGRQQRQGKTVLAVLPTEGWTRCSAGAGTPGPRWEAWRWLPRAAPRPPEWRRGLWGRRSGSDPTDLTASVVFAPHTTTLPEAVQGAGPRWTIESCFEAAKGAVGLDHYEVRSGTGWYRPITLAMWALALLAVLRAAHLPVAPGQKKGRSRPTPSSLARCKTSRGLLSH